MPLNTAGINALLEDGNEAVFWLAVGDGPTAADQTSAQRRQMTLSLSGVTITDSAVPHDYTGTPLDGATHGLYFSASTAGTFYGYDALTGDQAFNAAGEFSITSATITGSST